ncbi:MAG TPA: DNA repair protein RecO [Candidatus Dormibacteraeota bacterium]|nr:DNA repair protein RecO [Candidatus Dormibacteraeota bacterium]
MKQIITRGIVLSRTDYGEADRILTLLTPDQGKLRLMARGVRKPKSRLAGGIELFSTADITFIRGRGEIGTLISARLIKYYSTIVQDIDRVQLGYELIKILNRATEDHPEAEYFDLLEQTFAALDEPNLNAELINLWFYAQMLHHGGSAPDLHADAAGEKLDATAKYSLDPQEMRLNKDANGRFSADHIKFLRLCFGYNRPQALQRVTSAKNLAHDCLAPIRLAAQAHIKT